MSEEKMETDGHSKEIAALIARVDEWDGDPDYDLTRDVAVSLGVWKPVNHPTAGALIECDGDLFPDHSGAIYPAYLESLDAIVGLIEREGYRWRVSTEDGDAWVSKRRGGVWYCHDVVNDAVCLHSDTPACKSLLLAFLRAKVTPLEPSVPTDATPLNTTAASAASDNIPPPYHPEGGVGE